MDKLDCRILDALQKNFPLSEKPYEILSDELGIDCRQLRSRFLALIADGSIRRIGASLDSHKLGYYSTLAAISVEPKAIKLASEIVGKFSEVTHSYLRKDKFNIWFTVIAIDQQRTESILSNIRDSLSLKDSQILNLPMRRLFKLNACFTTLKGSKFLRVKR